MSKDDRVQSVKDGLNALHDHFDQIRHKHEREGNYEAKQGVESIQDKLEGIESMVESEDFVGALSSVGALRSISRELERHDDSFEWNDDPVVDEWVVELKTKLEVLVELES